MTVAAAAKEKKIICLVRFDKESVDVEAEQARCGGSESVVGYCSATTPDQWISEACRAKIGTSII